jgi:hypothetical protein
MKIKTAKEVTTVKAKSTGYGRLTPGRSYEVWYPGNRYVFVLDDTNNVNGYHIRNFEKAA